MKPLRLLRSFRPAPQGIRFFFTNGAGLVFSSGRGKADYAGIAPRCLIKMRRSGYQRYADRKESQTNIHKRVIASFTLNSILDMRFSKLCIKSLRHGYAFQVERSRRILARSFVGSCDDHHEMADCSRKHSALSFLAY